MELGSSLLHPLPRVNELSVEEAHAPNKVAIWRQVENGMYLRASIFAMIFGYEQSIVETVKKLNL